MNDIIRIGGRLGIICAVAAIILGGINALTEPRIEWIQQQRLEQALANVSQGQPTGDRVNVEDHEVVKAYYPIFEEGSEAVTGYVLRLIGNGYGGDMVILAGVRPDGGVVSAELLQNKETRGGGKEAEKDGYMDKFTGAGDDEPVPTRKDMLLQEQADAVSGSTITFVGIGNALAAASEYVKDMEG